MATAGGAPRRRHERRVVQHHSLSFRVGLGGCQSSRYSLLGCCQGGGVSADWRRGGLGGWRGCVHIDEVGAVG